MDANAKLELWHSEMDEKGIFMEEFVLENSLVVLNRPNNPPTYMSERGQSNIDITLATPNLAGKVRSWMVDASCSTSDHNLIITEIGGHNRINRNWTPDLGYNVK